MVVGVGTDIVRIDRFNQMSTFSYKRLRTFFSKSELSAAQDSVRPDCYVPAKLATRFAAKEAAFKAVSSALQTLRIQKSFSLRFLAQICSLEITPSGAPVIFFAWEVLEQKLETPLPKFTLHVSLSHEQEYALAFIVCEKV